LASPRLRLACNPQLSGHGERHDTNLRAMAKSGLRLAGRLESIDGTAVRFAPDLAETLTFADRFFDERFRGLFDRFAERAGESLPADEPSQVDHDPQPMTELDLRAERISTVVWTSGFRPATGWIEPPVFDEYGLPITTRGRTELPGLSFIGTPWLVDMGSANLVGLVRDAEAMAADW
jgi:putative flavoprotein involved in K+ transport